MLALRGMKQLLEKTRPYIILELTDSFLRELGSSAEALISHMTSAGYTVYPVKDTSHPLSDLATDQIDVLFVPTGCPVPSSG